MLKKPRPNPPKAKPAADTLSHADRSALARNAQYVGSPHHTDIPKFKIQAAPRVPFMTIEEAEAEKIKNPGLPGLSTQMGEAAARRHKRAAACYNGRSVRFGRCNDHAIARVGPRPR